MKPMMFVALAVGLAACTVPADSAGEDSGPTFGPRIQGRVIEGDGWTAKTADPASLDLAIFWHHNDTTGRDPYAPMKLASAIGSFPLDFAGTLPAAPSSDQLIPLHDAKTDVVPDPDAFVGFGNVYVLAHGALEDDPEGVESLDLDLVLGMSRDAAIFYTSVDLDTTEGLEPAAWCVDDWPLAAGYHLCVGSLEVDLASTISVELGYLGE
jgi:hypothetical protein